MTLHCFEKLKIYRSPSSGDRKKDHDRDRDLKVNCDRDSDRVPFFIFERDRDCDRKKNDRSQPCQKVLKTSSAMLLWVGNVFTVYTWELQIFLRQNTKTLFLFFPFKGERLLFASTSLLIQRCYSTELIIHHRGRADIPYSTQSFHK